jgi:hypothetical protein
MTLKDRRFLSYCGKSPSFFGGSGVISVQLLLVGHFSMHDYSPGE